MRVNCLAKEAPSNSETLGSKEHLKAARGPSTVAQNPGMCDQGHEIVPSSTVYVAEKEKKKKKTANNSHVLGERRDKLGSAHTKAQITAGKNRHPAACLSMDSST